MCPRQNDDGDEDTTSRGDRKRARRVREDALGELAKDLCALGEKRLERLELPESVREAIDEVRRIKSLPARARQLRVVRTTLRGAEWPVIRARLDQLLEHGSLDSGASAKSAAREALARQWAVKLVGEGTTAVDRLVAEHPNADRKHLSDLVRGAGTGSLPRRKRAEQRLLQALRSLFT